MNLEFNPKELHTISIALSDSKNRVLKQKKQLNTSYSELPDNFKFMWKDEEAYNSYREDSIKSCSEHIKDIEELEEKIEEIWSNHKFIII